MVRKGLWEAEYRMCELGALCLGPCRSLSGKGDQHIYLAITMFRIRLGRTSFELIACSISQHERNPVLSGRLDYMIRLAVPYCT